MNHWEGRRAWLKLYAARTLHGSTSRELTPAQRWVWIGLLCAAADSPVPGCVCVARNVPMTREQLAKLLQVDAALLQRALERLVETTKIASDEHGCIRIVNWEHYQGDYLRVRRHRERRRVTNETPRSPVTNETPTAAVTNETDRRRRRRRTEGEAEREGEREAAAAAAPDSDDLPHKIAQFVDVYEAEIANVSPAIAAKLARLATDFSLDEFREAVLEAVKSERRHLGYIEAILRRVASERGEDAEGK